MIILLYLYPLMGLVHIISAIGRYFSPTEKYPGYKNRLGNYLIGVIIYFIPIILVSTMMSGQNHNQVPGGLISLYFFIIPWGLASYYWLTIYSTDSESTTDINESSSDIYF